MMFDNLEPGWWWAIGGLLLLIAEVVAPGFFLVFIGAAAIATGLAAVSPRHGMAFSIVFMLFFDIPVGVLPATVAKISVTYQMRTLSGFFPSQHDLAGAIVAMLLVGGAWAALAAWRIRRLEA